VLLVLAATAGLGVVLISDDSSSDDSSSDDDTQASADEDTSEDRDDEGASDDDREISSPDDDRSDDDPSDDATEEDPDGGPAAEPPDVENLLPGELFVDPQESYAMHVDPTWTEHHGTGVAEIEAWAVAAPTSGFAPNINIVTQLFAGDLQAYMDVSTQGIEAAGPDASLVDHQIMQGTAGSELGVMLYTGSMQGRELHFAAVFFVDGETAVVATLTALPGDFADLFDEVGPHLLTLRPVQVDEL
jgi:hypothetical protein